MRNKFLYLTQPFRLIITGTSEGGKSCFLAKLLLNIIKDLRKNYMFIHRLYITIYNEKNKYFTDFIPINIMENILNEEVLDPMIDEIVNDEKFRKSETELESYESK